MDGLATRFLALPLQRRSHRPPITAPVDHGAFCSVENSGRVEGASSVRSISVKELSALLEDGGELVLIDVRNPSEADVAVIPRSQLIPLARIEKGEGIDEIRRLAGDRPIYVHCKLGGRSSRAVELLSQHGIDATNVAGGIDAWSQQVDPGIPRY